MKNKLSLFYLMIGLLFQGPVYAQEPASLLKTSVTDVTIKDEVFEQSFTTEDNKCICKISVNNIEDGEHMEYVFNAADMNEYKISFKTSKSSVYISVESKGGKELIRSYENGQVDEYVDDFVLYATDIEQARSTVEALRNLVKSCEQQQESIGFVLGENASMDMAADYLKNNIGKVSLNEQSYDQKFSANTDYLPLMKLEVTDVNEGEVIIYELNAADLNIAEIDFDVDDEFVLVTAETKGGRDVIKKFENGVLDDYQDELVFYNASIEDARKMVEVLQFYVEESEKVTSAEIMDIENSGDLRNLNEFITKNLKDVAIEDENFRQSFTYNKEKPYLVTITVEEVNEGDAYEYYFNMADLNENALSFNTSGNEVIIEMETSGEMDLIKEMENGELDEYSDDIEFMANGIEEARYLVEAFKKAVTMSKNMQQTGFIEGNESPTVAEAMNYLSSITGEVVIGEDAYKQKISGEEDDACLIHYEIIDVSEGETTIYKFNLVDINVYKIQFYADDEEVFVSLQTVGENELIEEIVDGTTEGFEDEINLRAGSIEQARSMQKALKYLVEKCAQ